MFDSLAALRATATGRSDDWIYRRYGHANAADLEACVAALEGTEGAVSFASGQAAMAAVLAAHVGPGGHVVASRHAYGGTLELLREAVPALGAKATLTDGTPESVRDALRPATLLILVETISNPTMRVADLKRLAALARRARARLVVDNTFATPVLCRPLSLGADVVVHSTTKSLCGHADAMGGIACANGPLLERLRRYAKIHGSISSPLDAWLTLRGVRTLDLRVRAASASALALARVLARHPKVRAVHYPGLPGAGSHVRTVLRGAFGAMLAFDLRGFAQAARLVRALRGDVPLAPSLGDVATTISHPASSSHAALTPAARKAAGIGEGLVRVSTGIEGTRDILDDFRRALAKI